MFTVGKRYEFRVIEGGEETRFWGVVEKYEYPLLKLEDFDAKLEVRLVPPEGRASTKKVGSAKVAGRILNVTSPSFVSAEEATD